MDRKEVAIIVCQCNDPEIKILDLSRAALKKFSGHAETFLILKSLT